MHTKAKGDLAENRVARFLEQNGYEICERNWYCRLGEIDIVCKKDGVLHFVEVKSGQKFNPLNNITPKKIDRVIKSAYLYMKANHINLPFSIDVVSLSGDSIELIENVTM